RIRQRDPNPGAEQFVGLVRQRLAIERLVRQRLVQQRRKSRIMTAVLNSPAALPTASWQDWSCLVRLVVTDAAAVDPAAADLRALMGRVERAASRFRPDSELSRANERSGRPAPVSRLLGRLVGAAVEAAERTGGALDPTL